MRVEIVTPGDGWVLDEMAYGIAHHIPNARLSQGRPSSDDALQLTFFMHYGLFKNRAIGRLNGCFFPHKEPPDPVYDNVASQVDFCVGMSGSSYADCLKINPNSHLIYPGINLSLFKPKLIVGFVGREYTSGRKGSELFEQLINIDWIDFRPTNGALPKEKVPEFIAGLDVILIASKYEGGPLCFLEALASGVEVISTEVGLAADFKEFPGVSLYPYGNFDALKKLLDEGYAKKLRLRDPVSAFTIDAFGNNYRKLFYSYINKLESKVSIFPV